ncbi:DUF974-domain-containing protein [Hygrophoropsis aurantiaca]|uniref:DUF974-domain-containing protein n=1 Tax=Hygrophoropsis aurantiaca TaxID=72124 RepID=A0ACB8A7U7_9AGAM|nr:DUF974-domain-containing protein [Hygrophoropsis aurantiaca]
MEGQAHLLSLKVMRVSRPGLSSAWKPFYSSSPSFSAHSTSSTTSLQGKFPLPGHPKTLRDLTHAPEFLGLPASFGTIQLGETFSSCICVNNDANVGIDGVTVCVEIQTANSKLTLTELGGSEYRLTAGDSLESIVHHEVKELGQHVLACTVTYRLPPDFRPLSGSVGDQNDPTVQGFRKFYKFVVTNPLSVKTKVHTSKSPSALLSQQEREKVFLEIHIQNLTPEPMWFRHIQFERADGWIVTDVNVIDDKGSEGGSLFSGSSALIQPQAVRQYIYILSPSDVHSIPVSYTPGTVIPLGRLDISWCSQFGEPGRLLTSMLSRRIPAPPQPQLPISSQPPASALPPYLQRAVPVVPSSPARPQSPQLPPSRSSSPPSTPLRPGSPFRNRSSPGPTRPQSPGPDLISHVPGATSQQTAIKPNNLPDLEVDMTVQHIPRDSIHVEKSFDITFRLSVAGIVPRFQGKYREVSMAVQRLQLSQAIIPPEFSQVPETSSRFSSSGFSSLSSMAPVQNSMAHMSDIPLVLSPKNIFNNTPYALPPPYFETGDDEKRAKLKGCTFLGTSALFISPIKLSESNTVSQEGHGADTLKATASCEFSLTYLPLQPGFVGVGGLRILLFGDRLLDSDVANHLQMAPEGDTGRVAPQIMKELDVIAEVWVKA